MKRLLVLLICFCSSACTIPSENSSDYVVDPSSLPDPGSLHAFRDDPNVYQNMQGQNVNSNGQIVTDDPQPDGSTSAGPPTSDAVASGSSVSQQTTSGVQLTEDGGVLKVPVLINGVITLLFVLDSGAADVSIPADVALTLMRTGTITHADFLGDQTYTLADGSTVPSPTFIIHTLKVGDCVINNVTGSISNVNGSLLLGQSFLQHLQSWSIDNSQQLLNLQGCI